MTPAVDDIAGLTSDFTQLQNSLNAKIGIAIQAVNDNEPPVLLGDWRSGSAWSTSKVPLVMAALRKGNDSQTTSTMTAAITESDNAAAESIWESLGDPPTAASAVQAVLNDAGDPTTVPSQKVRPEFSTFGQTQWSLENQVHFLSVAACDPRDTQVLNLMGQIVPGQSWGLGLISGTRFKGGWGPSTTGSYLVRQLGLVTTPTGTSAIAIAAEPTSGSFADGTQNLSSIGDWLKAHLTTLPSGHCGG